MAGSKQFGLSPPGGVHSYITPWYGSDTGKLAAGVSAAGLAADLAAGGYWIAKSDGGVDAFRAVARVDARAGPGQSVTGIAGE